MKKIALLSVILCFVLTINVSASTAALKDIKGHWAEKQIQTLVDSGVINGTGKGLFNPQGSITVSEYIKLCVAVLGHKYDIGSSGYWATPYINKALDLGIIYKGQFTNYERPITREEMAYIGIATYGKTNLLASSLITQEVVVRVKDYSLINNRYRDSVLNSYLVGILTGKPNSLFDPKGKSTRAEASVVVLRIIDEKQRQPLKIKSVPSTTTTIDFLSESSGWVKRNLVLYAPMDSKGNRVGEVISLFDFVNNNPLSKNGNGSIASYNTISETVDLSFFSETYSDYLKLSSADKARAVDLSIGIGLTKFSDPSLSPMTLTFFNIYAINYYSKLTKEHGDFLAYFNNILFADSQITVDEFMDSIVSKLIASKGQSVSDEYITDNGYSLLATGKGNSITIWVNNLND